MLIQAAVTTIFFVLGFFSKGKREMLQSSVCGPLQKSFFLLKFKGPQTRIPVSHKGTVLRRHVLNPADLFYFIGFPRSKYKTGECFLLLIFYLQQTKANKQHGYCIRNVIAIYKSL